MNYVYDIVLNWSDDKLFEFFEWEDDDEIEYIKKIPVFKISNFKDIKDLCFKVSNDFLKKINYKTEVYGNKKIETVEYSCVFCNDLVNEAIAFEFNDKGACMYRSCINLFDMEDIFEIFEWEDSFKLEYEIISKYKNETLYLTRSEMKKRKIIMSEINSAFDKNSDKLKYIYYEFFGKENDDVLYMKERLIKYLTLDINVDINYFYDCINISNFL